MKTRNDVEHKDRETNLAQGCSDEPSSVHTKTWLTPHRNLDIRKIVVPIDFSPSSRKALRYAVATASEFGAEIWLVHVVRPYPTTAEMPGAMMELNSQRTETATKLLEQWAKTIRVVRVAGAVRLGDPATEISELAKQNHADLIVMATSGRQGLAHLVIGSVAEKVVRTAPCPVLTVRDDEQDFLKVEPDDPVLNRAGLVLEEATHG
jgi:universal stress protein A